MALLRRIYRAPELFQLLATFGVVLMVQDVVLRVWGPDDLTAAAPALAARLRARRSASAFPAYDLVLIAVGPLVLAALWLLFRRTRWGTLVRAATQDREMVARPRRRSAAAVHHGVRARRGAGRAWRRARRCRTARPISASISAAITDAFVVVVVGGLGSLPGAYLAALLIGVLQAFGIVLMPKATLVLVFVVMAVVLVLRPNGLLGRPRRRPRSRPDAVPVVRPRRAPLRVAGRGGAAARGARRAVRRSGRTGCRC